MVLWRIASETRRYGAADLTGAGAAAKPGRWNAIGEPVLYAAPTLAMAVLETAAHIDDAGLPQNRFVVRIDVPDKIWRARTTLGSKWLREGASALLEVPSVIVPEESVVVINPAHRDSARIKAAVVRPFEYQRLYRRG